MKETGPEAKPPLVRRSRLPRRRGEVGAGAGAEFEEHPFRTRQAEDGIHGILDGIDEARGALRLALQADIEPDRAVEGRFLVQEQVGQLIGEDASFLRAEEVAVIDAPAGDRLHHARDERFQALLACGLAQADAKIFGDHDVGGHLRPESGHFYVMLLEDHFAVFRCNARVTFLPFHFRKWMNAFRGEIALEMERTGLAGAKKTTIRLCLSTRG